MSLKKMWQTYDPPIFAVLYIACFMCAAMIMNYC